MVNIHPLWYICILIRLSLIIFIRYSFYNLTNVLLKNLLVIILLIMGSGFIYKYLTGSNNEHQIAKVFWHNSRLVHGVLYLLSSYYLFIGDINMNSLILSLDIISSFLYRFVFS